MRGGKIRHNGFSRRKNNKCRNPSHACTPRRNPSPPLRPVTAAFARLLTDQHPIWSVLRVIWGILQLRVYNLFGTDTCFAWNLFVTGAGCLQKHHHHLHPHAEKQGIQFFCYNFRSPQIQLHRAGIIVFSSALLAFKGRIAHLMANPWTFKSLGRCARHAQIYFFCGALAPRLANAPFVETRSLITSKACVQTLVAHSMAARGWRGRFART